MKTYMRRLFAIAGLLLELLGPMVVLGPNLFDLYTTGTMDDYYEFCDFGNGQHFVFGAAKDCDLSFRQVAWFAVFSYARATVLLLPLSVFLVFLSGWIPCRDRRVVTRTLDAEEKLRLHSPR